MADKNLQNIRKDYQKLSLDESMLADNPITQFKLWFDEYHKLNVVDDNAMVLSTVSDEGKPKSRIVLLKGIVDDSFEFYTNYKSAKGQEIEANPNVSLNFFWKEMERQVRVEGKAERLSPEASNQYFSVRPRGSQIGAWTSPQSEVLQTREDLEAHLVKYEAQFKGVENIPRPDFWGGYKVIPERVEFWQGRSSRLHDRLVYEKVNKVWTVLRLAP